MEKYDAEALQRIARALYALILDEQSKDGAALNEGLKRAAEEYDQLYEQIFHQCRELEGMLDGRPESHMVKRLDALMAAVHDFNEWMFKMGFEYGYRLERAGALPTPVCEVIQEMTADSMPE